jgi:hypothetical protein
VLHAVMASTIKESAILARMASVEREV